MILDQRQEQIAPYRKDLGASVVSATSPQTRVLGSSIWSIATESNYWSPNRIFQVLWGVLSTIPQQIEIRRVMSLPVYAMFVRNEPKFRFKFLISDYLVRNFSARQRTSSFLHHYKRLHSNMSASLLHQTLNRRVTLLEEHRDDMHLEISLALSRPIWERTNPFEKEGELSLNLEVDGAIVFVLSFTIVPGKVIQSDAEEVILISRLQGTPGCYPQIKMATKAMHDVGPSALLLAALQGFAQAFEINRMAGVSASRQSSYNVEFSRYYNNAYDGFFSELDMQMNNAGFYLGSIPLEERPLSSVKQGHKIRTRKKRELKRQIAEDVYMLLGQGLNATRSQPSSKEDVDSLAVCR